MIICHKCGKQNYGDPRFCEDCGTMLETNIIADSIGGARQETEKRAETAAPSPLTESAAELVASAAPESAPIPSPDNSAEGTLNAPAPAPVPAAAKKQRASLFTEPNSILDRIQNKKPEKNQASVPDSLQTLPQFTGNKPSKSAGEIFNIAIAAITGIGVLWLCFYLLKRKFGGK